MTDLVLDMGMEEASTEAATIFQNRVPVFIAQTVTIFGIHPHVIPANSRRFQSKFRKPTV